MSAAPTLPAVKGPRALSLATLLGAALLLFISQAQAQWVIESYPLKAGWNAVWLSPDCSDRTIESLLPEGTDYAQIVEIWRWNPLGSTVQFTQSPSAPIQADTSWSVWRRGDPNNSTLGKLTGNAAYLFSVKTTASPFTLELLGKPLPPTYNFSSSGLNFLGFPAVATPTNSSPLNFGTPSFDTYFSFSEALKSQPQVFHYVGGALSDVFPKNPLLLTNPRFATVARGRAYWVKGGSYSDYYGPLQVTVLNADGIDFGKKLNTSIVRIKNVTDPLLQQTVTATFALSASQAGPDQPFAPPQVPLRLRGPRNASLQYTYSALPSVVTLAPGEEKELVFDANRAQMASAGTSYQSILRVTDSLGHTRIDLPVSAIGSSKSGLWIGAATLDAVNRVETITGPEFDAPIGAANGQGAETTSVVTTLNTTASGQTTSATTYEAAFDAAGNIYLSSALFAAANVAVTGVTGTPTYSQGSQYTVVSSGRATVTNGGSGYTAAPNVSLSGGTVSGAGGVGTATITGQLVTGVTVTNGGSGYLTPPRVTFTGGGGTGATGTAAVSNGIITSVTMTSGGSGYTSAPSVAFTVGGATATATLSGSVTGVSITDGGNTYNVNPPIVSFTGGGGTGATAIAVISGGRVTDVTVTNGGSGYSTPPTVVFTGGGNLAAATAKIVGSVASVTFAPGGSNYTAAPQIVFTPVDGKGSGATATVDLVGGVLTGVRAIQKGTGIASIVRVTVSTQSAAPAGTLDGSTASTVTTYRKLVTLNRKSHYSTRRISSGTGAAAPSLFPIRLVLHAGANGAPVTLLQQVYLGERNGTAFAGPTEAAIAALVTSTGPTPKGRIVRISSASFPRGVKWTGAGNFGTSATFTVTLGYDEATNPFLHTYHPDHDNWDARYAARLPAGDESYTVQRDITLTFSPTLPEGITDLDWGVTTVGGTYSEVFRGLRSQDISVSGAFILHQVSEVPTLTLSPP